MTAPKTAYDYGECEMCDARLEERYIHQDFWIKGQLVVIENVPAGCCPQCGAKVVNAETGVHIAGLIGNAEQIAKAPRLAVPLLHYQTAK